MQRKSVGNGSGRWAGGLCRTLVIGSLSLAMGGGPSMANGEPVEWILGDHGFWTEAGNWSSLSLPDQTDDVSIDRTDDPERPAEGYLITLMGEAQSIRSLVSSERLRITAGPLSIAEDASFNNLLDVDGGTLNVSGTLNIGDTGTLTLPPHGMIHAGGVDNAGSFDFTGGTLVVENGVFRPSATMEDFHFGSSDASSPATLRLVGDQAVSENIDGLHVGGSGHAALELLEGATLSTDGRMWVGEGSSSNGDLLISGGGSRLNVASTDLFMNHGTIHVEDGGRIHNEVNSSTRLAAHSHGDVSVVVTDEDTLWHGRNFIVGHDGEAQVTVKDGARLRTLQMRIGNNSGSEGTLIITGEDTFWDKSSGQLYVGGEGDGTLEIRQGATVEMGGTSFNAPNILIGEGHRTSTTGDAWGTLTVSGAGSTLRQLTPGSVQLGGSDGGFQQRDHVGQGRLIVEDGGQFIALGSVRIGNTTGSHGELIVTGSDEHGDASYFESTAMHVGHDASGSVLVADGAELLIAGNSRVGSQNNSNGQVTVTTGGQLSIEGQTYIGQSGDGTVTISEGGVLVTSDANTRVGSFGGVSTGTVTVTGAGSRWETGTNVEMAWHEDKTGIVNIEAGALWDVGGGVRVARDGHAELTVASGGRITTQSTSVIGNRQGSVGHAMVTGVDPLDPDSPSRWDINGQLRVGHHGDGTLVVADGAIVHNTSHGYVGREDTGTGHATITGAGSRWTSDASINIAGTASTATDATGALLVTDHAVVEIGAGHALNVWDNGTLRGDGTVLADVIAHGTIHADNPDSALGIAGTLTLMDGSTLAGPGAIDGDIDVADGAAVTFQNLETLGMMHLDGGNNHITAQDTIFGGSFNVSDNLQIHGAGLTFKQEINVVGGGLYVELHGSEPGATWDLDQTLNIVGDTAADEPATLNVRNVVMRQSQGVNMEGDAILDIADSDIDAPLAMTGEGNEIIAESTTFSGIFNATGATRVAGRNLTFQNAVNVVGGDTVVEFEGSEPGAIWDLEQDLMLAGDPAADEPATLNVRNVVMRQSQGVNMEGAAVLDTADSEMDGPLQVTGGENRITAHNTTFDGPVEVSGEDNQITAFNSRFESLFSFICPSDRSRPTEIFGDAVSFGGPVTVARDPDEPAIAVQPIRMLGSEPEANWEFEQGLHLMAGAAVAIEDLVFEGALQMVGGANTITAHNTTFDGPVGLAGDGDNHFEGNDLVFAGDVTIDPGNDLMEFRGESSTGTWDFDTADVAPFVQLLVRGNSPTVPEPGSLALLGLGGLMLLRRRR